MAELGAVLHLSVGGVYLRGAFMLMPTACENAGCKGGEQSIDAGASSSRGTGGSAAG